jgi:crotonobetainyl-CoA:carnitine CoA-transferase CaiB-like acyl-CoA transferase
MLQHYWTDLSEAVFGAERSGSDFQDPVFQGPDFQGAGEMASVYPVADFAQATVGIAAAAWAQLAGLPAQSAAVDRRLAALWFQGTVAPLGWEPPSIWDAIAGDYQCADGWIRLHTNAPHHRDAALSVLGVPAERDRVAKEVRDWRGAELERQIVAANGCAAQMRDPAGWRVHPQGRAIAQEPLVHWSLQGTCPPQQDTGVTMASLKGVKILDLTRVLAGPVATRFLAGLGADVLRIDPPKWNEPAAEIEVTLGKLCAGLDLREAADLATLKDLMRRADVFVHGYRPGALDRLGLGRGERHALNPHMIDVCLNAYGWTGPWSQRRGFDSLVQMSCGIAAAGMMHLDGARPHPLPVQALDHGTGYLMAACVLEALRRRSLGEVCDARVSLARTALLLMKQVSSPMSQGTIQAAPGDFLDTAERTTWGPIKRMRSPVTFSQVPMQWGRPAGALRRDLAAWS